MSEKLIMEDENVERILAEVMQSFSFAAYHEITVDANDNPCSFIVNWELQGGQPVLSQDSFISIASTGVFAKLLLGTTHVRTDTLLNACARKLSEQARRALWSPSEKIKRKTFHLIGKPAC